MVNIFDQFDAQPVQPTQQPQVAQATNVFDQFDAPVSNVSAGNLDVPGGGQVSQAKPTKTTFSEKMIGAGEAARTLVTGATTGALGFLGGTIEGAAKELTGQIPRGAGLELAQERAGGLTFEPKTKVGKEILSFIGEKLGALPPVLGGVKPIISAKNITMPKKATIPKSKARHIRGVLSDEIKAGNINAGNIAKTLDADGSLINNPRTKAAIKLLGEGDGAYSTAINFEKMNNATRIQFNKMLDVIDSNKKSGDKVQAVTNRPVNIIGASIAKRVKILDDKKTAASKKLGVIVNGEGGAKIIDVSQARDRFIRSLSDSDIDVFKTNNGLKADTSRTLTNINEVIKDNRLNNVINRVRSGNLTLKDAHKLKRNLRELVDFDPKAPGATKVSAEIERTVKSLASDLNSQISAANKSYGVQNKIMSESVDALKKADKALGNTLTIGDELSESKFGALSKRIGTNLASKENVTDLLRTLDESLSKRGVVLKDDIERLVVSLDDLEKVFKLESEQAPFGFQARVGKGALEAVTTGTATAALTGAALDAAKKLNKLDFKDKMKALRILSKVNKEKNND